MSNTWIPNDGEPKEEFDLFAPNTEDNLQDVLAKGSYKWTNKYTAVFAIALVVVTSASAGIWYGHRSASSTGVAGIAGAAGFSRSGFTRGSGGGSSAAGGGAAAFAGGGFGGSRVSGTVVSVKGNTVTVTADSDPSATVKAGDTVSVRVSGAGAAAPGAAPAGVTASGATTTKSTKSKKNSSTTGSTTTSNLGATPAPAASGAPRGGGFASNPEFVACLKKEGVTIVAGQRLDRTDPKVAAALQSCFSTLGGPGGGFGGGRQQGAPAPASTTNP